ncbi:MULTISPECIES: hypothetical protein [unclassified Inquilinus]|uniref:hypothetical protein n=1 Tax=unclassified Inquilinus TaxID=2645927 RepID=UPI003F91AD32
MTTDWMVEDMADVPAHLGVPQADRLIVRPVSLWVPVFDDIRFNDGMYRCFLEIEQAEEAAAEIKSRVEIMETEKRMSSLYYATVDLPQSYCLRI